MCNPGREPARILVCAQTSRGLPQGQRFWARQVSATLRLQLAAASVQVAIQLVRRGSILNSRARHSAIHSERFGSQVEAPTQASQSGLAADALWTGAIPTIKQAMAAITVAHASDRARDDGRRSRRWRL